ncbi:MAG TPA: pyridoxamine 5'-phosphate oxidase [Jatrophihabitans sp.]|nr:pyridoxamine 5'-phosphate oxidase [Jatrophihabitans sp.]
MNSPADPLSVRRSYESGQLSEDVLAPSWREQLQTWYDQAAADDRITDPNAMQLATAGADCLPDVRTVLARGFDELGVVFYTGYDSAKGRQLAENPAAAAVFSWLPMERQVRFRGPVRKVDRAQTEAYFAGRPRGSQLAAWASPQSQPLADRGQLEQLLAEVTERFADGPIQAPPGWGGYRIIVREMEFWQGRQFRLHDRLRYRQGSDGGWTVERLAP